MEPVVSSRPSIRLPGPKAAAILAAEARSVCPGITRRTPLVWASASGSTITDVDGNEFLDLGSGILITNIGHAHPRVTAAVAEAAAKSLTFYNFPHPYRATLSDRLTALMPDSITRVAYYSSGSEAVDAAVRISRLASGRSEIIGFEGAFHGKSYLPMSVSGLPNHRRGFGPFVGGISHAPYPSASRDADRNWRRPIEETVASLPSQSIAAIIAEPFQGAGGVVIPPADFLPYLREICDRVGALLIVDEVQAGYGRSGPMFAIEHSGVRPDIVVLAKAMANGFPISAVLASEAAAGQIPEERISNTFGGNPVACAAALAVLDVFETEHVLEQGRRLADALADILATWRREMDIIGEVRQQGMAIGVELVNPDDGGRPFSSLARRVIDVALSHGVVVNLPIGPNKNVLRIGPALTMPIDQATEAMHRLRESLTEARSL